MIAAIMGFLYAKASHIYRRLIKPVGIGARVACINERGEVLLVLPIIGEAWWYLPGGGAKRGESLPTCAARELREETGIRIDEDEDLKFHGMFMAFRRGITDHVAVYHATVSSLNTHISTGLEIRKAGYFPTDDLPENTSPATRRRVNEIAHGLPAPGRW